VSRRLSILVLHPFIFLLSLVGRGTPACRRGVRGKDFPKELLSYKEILWLNQFHIVKETSDKNQEFYGRSRRKVINEYT
jgi:hypothetical protein